MKGDVNMPTLINENAIAELVEQQVNKLTDERLLTRLDGITWSTDQFRKACCGGKDSGWVTTFILDKFLDEIDYYHGGWLIRGGRGKANIIFAKPACEWMEKNRNRIDWEAKI